MKQILYIILFFCLLTSCSGTKKPIYGVSFPEEVVLDKSKEIYSKEVISLLPSQLELKDSLLFLCRTGECAALLFNEKDMKEVAKFGMQGIGPEFFQSPHFVEDMEQNDCFYVEDITMESLRKFRMYNQDDSLFIEKVDQKPLYSTKKIISSGGSWVNNQYYAAYKWEPENKETTFFSLRSKNMEYLTSFMDLPVPEKSSDFSMFSGYQTSLGNLFYFVCSQTGYIVCYEINSPQDIKKKWEYWFNKPIYSLRKGTVRWDAENLRGCYDIKATSKYIYCLYSGKKETTDTGGYDELPETILIFEPDGTPVKKIHLNKRYVRFAVSDDDKYMYLLYSSPDVGVAKYQIN